MQSRYSWKKNRVWYFEQSFNKTIELSHCLHEKVGYLFYLKEVPVSNVKSSMKNNFTFSPLGNNLEKGQSIRPLCWPHFVKSSLNTFWCVKYNTFHCLLTLCPITYMACHAYCHCVLGDVCLCGPYWDCNVKNWYVLSNLWLNGFLKEEPMNIWKDAVELR